MSSVPVIRQISPEDVDADDAMRRLLEPLNQFMDATYLCLSKGITIDENRSCTVVTQTIQTESAYWEPYSGLVDNTVAGFQVLAGVATVVPTPAVAANSSVLVTRVQAGGAPGFLGWSTRISGTSFTITSTNAGENGSAEWVIMDPLAGTFPVVKFQTGLQRKARSVQLLQIQRQDGEVIRRPVTVTDWIEQPNGTITIRWMSGLGPSVKYTATFLVE